MSQFGDGTLAQRILDWCEHERGDAEPAQMIMELSKVIAYYAEQAGAHD